MLKTWCNNSINLLKTAASLHQQIRTTFVLKRKYQPLLHKTNAKSRKLRAKHFIYELVEDTNTKPKPNLEVILKTYVEGLGDKGDVVSVKPNFAYNKLLLPGLAVYKTEVNEKLYAKSEEEKKQKVSHSSPFAQRTVNVIERFLLAVVMNKDQPWVVEPWHIKASLRKAGIQCPEECIEMPKEPIEGPDMNKEGKEFCCTITINNMEKARLRCRIHHWSTEPSDRLPYVFEFWKIAAEPLFGTDKAAQIEEVKLAE